MICNVLESKRGNNMYSIGQFSVMFQVNKKTLRYYDDIGLFKPSYVDQNNQYRYYDKSQIPVMKELLRLREIGLSLEDVRLILADKGDDVLKQSFSKRLKEIEKEKRELDRQKLMIENYTLNEAEQTDKTQMFTVEEGSFMPSGYIYYNEVNCEMDQIHNYIGYFYEKAKTFHMQGAHYFKIDTENDSSGVSEIFAYVDESNGQNVKKLEAKDCLKVEFDGIELRSDAYRTLFDYTVQKNYSINSIYEQYQIYNGRMHISIIAAV